MTTSCTRTDAHLLGDCPDHHPARRQVRGRPEDYIACRVCGRAVLYARSRLFWVGEGTVRTCSAGLDDHTAPATAATLEDIVPMA